MKAYDSKAYTIVGGPGRESGFDPTQRVDHQTQPAEGPLCDNRGRRRCPSGVALEGGKMTTLNEEARKRLIEESMADMYPEPEEKA